MNSIRTTPPLPEAGPYPEGGVGWYRKSFVIPDSDRGKRIFIDFDNIYQKSTVWLNGHMVDDLCAVMNAQVPNYKTAIVRDIFVFCCFTGLAYVDVDKLTCDDIHTDEQGDMWIIDKRQKTGTQFRVKLLPVAKQLVERYRHLRLPNGKVFPTKDRNSMNMSLRHIAKHAGLSFNPTMHMARHTFATTVTLTQGVPLETVSKMLGHKRITTTQIYARITNDKIGKDMDALSEKLDSVFKVAQ